MSKITNELRERLGVFNAFNFARRGKAPGFVRYSTQHARAYGYGDRKGRVITFTASSYTTTTHRPRGKSAAEDKQLCIAAALEEARAQFGISDWRRSPWPNDYVPVEAYDKVMAELKAHRKAHPKTEGES